MYTTLASREANFPTEVKVNWKALKGSAIGSVCTVGRTDLADVLLCSGFCGHKLYISM